MKIYYRKNFISGIWLVLIGLVLLVLQRKTQADWKDIVLIGACFFMGGGLLLRSTSPKFSKEDRLEEMDERNQLVQLKNRSCAFQIVEYGNLLLAAFFFAAGKIQEDKTLICVGVGLMFSFCLCLFSDLFAFLYYDRKL